jgi:Na+/melibiose symporter-like transporter
VIGGALGASGFAPNQPQGETVLLTLRVLLSLFPLACYALGSFLFLGFGLDRAEHSRVQREIDATRSCVAAA